MNTQDTQPTLFGHPKGLFYLFFAELWERFSFYGMRALLTLYMTQHLLYSDELSFGIFAAYGSLVYVTPLIGGILADKILGYKKAIILGGVLMAVGHFALAIEHPIAFYTALALLIIGNGFFKPNISSFVGTLYEEGDNRRDAGFMIFYMGVNIGGWIAPLLCGWLGITYGWHYGFGLAGIGMLLGLLVFNKAVKNGVFGGRGNVSNNQLYGKKIGFLKVGNIITVGAILAVPIMALLVKYNEFEHYLVWIVSAGIFAILVNIYLKSTKKEKGQLLVVIYFTVLACLFFTVFEQAGSSLTLFAKRNVNLQFINASQSNSLNSAYIILFALPFTWLWTYLSRIGKNPNSPFKMGMGLVLVGIGFLIFGYSSQFLDAAAEVPMLFLVGEIFIYTLGELFLSPVGLSKVTELSPKKFLSFLMGVWFLASFYGHFFAGKIAQLTTVVEGEESPFTQGIFETLTPMVTGLNYATVAAKGEAFLQLYSYVSVFTGIGLVTFFNILFYFYICMSNEILNPCPCGLPSAYEMCCQLAHRSLYNAKTAEQLMRSRYTAFTKADGDYLMKSHHSSTRPLSEKKSIVKWAKSVEWVRLEILNTELGQEEDSLGSVEFKAYFKDKRKEQFIHENSKFIKEKGVWVYLGII